eukprot:CAMPEP_0173393420 /NCGR_PEP_ID=MMETSP1356-20130122/22095_1 /TAXON_ID=77927 ORGANISM="Hemiselmis virescens, Strain PCC157" /NCGR_SAMPLE_ID=MMETSP1356 /ASSEMBLY_ACC=CAM_ASM_000847 /LENGTH=410 /DNA_ID=CAMNT_0014351431 /DNA_START=163 /DNA_END=1392 /DNA_ORIENTATION=-
MSDDEDFKAVGNALYKAGKYQEAVDAYTKAIEKDPTEPMFFGNRAAALMMLKKYDDALADSKAAVALDVSFVKGYVRGTKCFLLRGMLFEARAMINQLLERDPACPEAVKELAIIDQVEKDISQARDRLAVNDHERASYFVDRIVPICPDSSVALSMRADMLIGRKKYDDAASVCWALLAKDRQNPDLLFLRGKALLYGGSTESGMKHMTEALRVDPDHSRSREMLKMIKAMERAKNSGNESFKEGRCEEAISFYTEALSLDPTNCLYNATVYCNRAASKMRLKKYKDALEDCEESAKLNPTYVKAITRKAECLLQLEEYETCVHTLEAAMKMEPESSDINQRLREAKLELKKSKRKNYYKILDVAKDAGENDIKKAYKRAALKYHPDKWANSTEEEQAESERAFKDIGE